MHWIIQDKQKRYVSSLYGNHVREKAVILIFLSNFRMFYFYSEVAAHVFLFGLGTVFVLFDTYKRLGYFAP